MANTIGFGQAAVNNTIDYGQGAIDNTINWGKSQTLSPSGETNITGTGGTPPFTNTKSILLDGVDDYVAMGDVLDFERTDAFSISAWVKRGGTGVNDTVVSKMESSGNYRGYLLFIGSANVVKFVLRHQNTPTARLIVDSTSTITDTNWHHISVTYDGSSSVSGVKIYIDGVSDTVTTAGTLNATILNSSPFNIGARNSNSLFATATIDEVSVFNTELSASDVTSIYNGGVPNDISSLSPLSWWRCGDGDTSPTLTDNGSGGNDGTMTNFSTFSTDVPSASSFTNTKSILLDGIDDYVEVADADNLSFGNGTTDSPFSISAWVKMTDATRFRIVFKADNTTGNNEYGFFCDASDRINFILYDSTLSVSRGRYYNVGLSSYQGQWINLVATYDGQGGTSAQNGIKIYLNGTQVDNVDVSTGTYTAMHNGNAPLEIGKFLTNRSNGLMDEIAIFNVELSASDVTSIYNGGVPNDISSLSPLSWWRCGDGDTAPTLTDNGSGGNDGTMTNFTTFSTDVPT